MDDKSSKEETATYERYAPSEQEARIMQQKSWVKKTANRRFRVGDWVSIPYSSEPCRIDLIVDNETCKLFSSQSVYLNIDLEDCVLLPTLRPYWCGFKDEDWSCMALAYSHNQAKAIFLWDNPAPNHCQKDYIAIQARLAKAAVVPKELTEPRLFEACSDAEWICAAAGAYEYCRDCRMPGATEKARQFSEEDIQRYG